MEDYRGDASGIAAASWRFRAKACPGLDPVWTPVLIQSEPIRL
jgi:hypothetical protein